MSQYLLNMLKTDQVLGRGMTRTVYAGNRKLFNDDVVVKIEEPCGHFQNVMEANLWERLEYSQHAKYLAPVLDISDDGRVLVQRRTVPALWYPKFLPSFFTDFNKSNFGMLDEQFVCHDYAKHLAIEQTVFGKLNLRIVKEWRNR